MSDAAPYQPAGGERSPGAVWLEAHLDGVPSELADAIRRTLAEAPPAEPDAEVGRTLADLALAELVAAVESDQRRPAALRLLAADALLTYAFEAAADLEEDAEALARDIGPRGRIGGTIRKIRSAREE